MHTLGALFAFGWAPEIRGIVFVLIAVVVLMGSIYMILSTNVGGRLGLLIVLAALFGWMTCMAGIWATYGIGLKGKDPSWVAKDIINDGNLANASHPVARDPSIPTATTDERVNGWIQLQPDDPKRGQAVAAADEVIIDQKVMQAGTYQATAVFDKGGQRGPFHLTWDAPNWWPGVAAGDTWQFDWLAFFHKPHYALVEIRPLVPQNTEPGRAPPAPVIDESQPPRYVLLERDLGNRRRPAFLIMFGAAILFLIFCFMLHRRDRLSSANRAVTAGALPASTGA
jgi:hypothetical protein